MPKSIVVRYGRDDIKMDVPAKNLFFAAGLPATHVANDFDATIRRALAEPVGSEPLAMLAGGQTRVVVVVDDLTRPTPAHLILPRVVEELAEAGVPQETTEVLIATGTHRPMNREEIERKIGREIAARFRVLNHDHRDLDNLVDLGTTPSGIPITVNRRVAEADLVIGIGNVVPHRYCGWAGGSKIIQPGVSSEATTAATHLMITKDPGARLGQVENRVRQEIEAVGDRVSLRFIVNTILDRNGDLVDVVAGDPRKAFREAVHRASPIYTVPIPGRADVVFASAYPNDLNFWQAGKALYAADAAVRPGGIIVLVSPCSEGIGEHREFRDLLVHDYETLDHLIRRDGVEDRIGAAAALAVTLVRANADVWLVAEGVTAEDARRMSMRRFETVDDALAEALRVRGDNVRIAVLNEAAEIAPVTA
jgi:nickel-dependent lactate racemase